MITNYQDVQIKKTEIYPTIFDYELPDGYHFETEGFKWGNHIYGGDPLTNHYIVKKDEDNPEENIHQ